MNNKSYELTVSNNMEYMAGICRTNKIKEMYEMKAWCIGANQMREICVWFVNYDFGGERFAVSNDGKYVATAQYGTSKGGNLHIYEIESGEDIFEEVSLRGIQWVAFSDYQTLMVGTEEKGIFTFNIFSGTCDKKMKGKKFFGENILLLEDKKIMYMGRNFKASTFAYLTAKETPKGILVSEAGGNLCYYHNDGQLYWRTDCLNLGHFIIIHYNRNKDIVFGVLLNPRKEVDERMHFVALNHNTGKVIFVNSIDSADYVFVEFSESVMLVNGRGKKYTFINNHLEEDIY